MLEFTKKLSGLLIVGAIFFAACQSADTTPTDRIALSLHQTARIGADVTVRADSIQDSRCPKDVNCIWAGQAKVKLLLANDIDSTTVRLALGADSPGQSGRQDSTSVSLSNTTYKVILREVNPFPTSTNLDQPRTATVQVTKL